jgi:tight adherence protein C
MISDTVLWQGALPIFCGLLVAAGYYFFWLAQREKHISLISSRLTTRKLPGEKDGGQVGILRPTDQMRTGHNTRKSSIGKIIIQPIILHEEMLSRQLIQAGLRDFRAKPIYYYIKIICCLIGGLFGYFGEFGLSSVFPGPWIIIVDIVSFSFAIGLLPFFVLSYLIQKRKRALEEIVPDLVDLLVLCMGAGLTLEASLRKTVQTISGLSPVLADEMKTFLSELQILPDKSTAFINLQNRTSSESLKYLLPSLRQSEIYGTSIMSTLRMVAKEHRKAKLHSLDSRAARLPVLLSFPLIICILPPVVVISVGPGFIMMLKSFGS